MQDIYLETLIKELEKMDQSKTVPFGFGEPESYRGYYEDLAFRPLENAHISDMVKHAKSSLDKEFIGYKGGEFVMVAYTDCWIADYGSSAGDKIGETLINYWKLHSELL